MALPFFLVAVLVAAGVYPVTSQAASKTTYTVVIQEDSPNLLMNSINGGAPGWSLVQNEGTTFQLEVETKVKTEKVKSTKQKASYYNVKIPKKSYKGADQEVTIPGVGDCVKKTVLAKDAKGKLYISGGDVDITQLLGKKLKTQIGDGKADPEGSMILTIDTKTDMIIKDTGKKLMTTKSQYNFTTGKTRTSASGSKTKLDGRALPDNDTTETLSNPMVGEPVDLKAGTGTLVSTMGFVNIKNKVLGTIDNLAANIWVLKLTEK